VWPTWSTFGGSSPNTVGSALAGILWTGLAVVGVMMFRDRTDNAVFGIVGSTLALVFGGAVIGGIAVQLARHRDAPITLPIASACIFVLILVVSHFDTLHCGRAIPVAGQWTRNGSAGHQDPAVWKQSCGELRG